MTGVYIGLSFLILVVYAQVAAHPFVNLDDDRYVTDNARVKQGLTLDNVAWALTTDDVSNWHPLTWLSHMLDCQIFGNNASGPHLVNVALHLANTLLLFEVLRRMTGSDSGAVMKSALVAALFAVHPLHVESVAWIAERKDVLSSFFGLSALCGYLWYSGRPEVKRCGVVVLLFALSLMVKPMLVTLPLLFLLLDYWPLGRFGRGPLKVEIRRLAVLVCEKVPLLALSTASSIITVIVQRRAGSTISVEDIPLFARLGNAAVSYVRYMLDMVWPSNLAVFYPHLRSALPVWQIAGAMVLLAAVTAAAFLLRRNRPYLLVGWLWFLGTLAPVIGVVQVGLQARADRYTYVPLIGLFIAAVWSAGDFIERRRVPRFAARVISAAILVVLMVFAIRQVWYWRDSETLFNRALAVTANNSLAHYNLGVTLMHQDRNEEALHHFAETVRLDPADPNAHANLGVTLVALGRLEAAIPQFQEAIRLRPDNANAEYNLGTTFFALSRYADAISAFEAARRLDPARAEVHYNLGTTLYRLDRLPEAAESYQAALRVKPEYSEAHINLGNVLTKLGRPNEAEVQYKEVLKAAPDRLEARVNLGYALAQQGKLVEAAAAFQQALDRNPSNAALRKDLKALQDEIARRGAAGAASSGRTP